MCQYMTEGQYVPIYDRRTVCANKTYRSSLIGKIICGIQSSTLFENNHKISF